VTQDNTSEIGLDELDWEEAVVREGRLPGAVVSVRLDPAETARLRHLANSLGMNLSQVLRRALAGFDPDEAHSRERPLIVGAFTYGGTVPLSYEQSWHYVGSAQLHFPAGEQRGSGTAAPTATEPTRIVERVTV
jgi:hypothetical protein